MSFRVTTNGMFRMYRSNLHNSYKKLNKAMEKVDTERQFNAYYEDPAAAARAFSMRRAFSRADAQVKNSDYVISKFQTAWGAIGKVVDGDEESPGINAIATAIRGLTDTAGAGRAPLGQQMLGAADNIVNSFNITYGENYVFSGADGKNVALTWDEDGKTLLYRGVDVTSGGNAKLKSMANEATYVDIGLGLQEDQTGNIIPASAYNSALSALNFLGYGVDEDGDSKNLVVLMKELGNIFANCNSSTGEFDPDPAKAAELKERAWRLAGKIQQATDHAQEMHIKLDTQAEYLRRNRDQLEDEQYTLNEQINDLERLELGEAITEMSWVQYSYNAALKIGNNILSQSLLDYMN